MRRWTHFIMKIIIIKSCFSKIKMKVASRCSVNIMIDYSFFIIGFSLMVELNIELSSSVNYPVKTIFQSSRSLFHVDYFLWLVSYWVFIGLYLFIYLFYFFCCRLLSTQRILTFLCKIFLVKRLIIHWSSSINKGVFICELKYLIKYAR